MPVNLPTTPAAAPPNFYSQAGAMAAGQGAGAGASSAASSQPGQGQDDPAKDQEFLENTTKLLDILNKMAEMKPKGQDITKFMKAAAAPIQDCIEQVFHGQQPGGTGQPADGSVADSGSAGAGGAAAPQVASAPDTGSST